MGKDIKEQSTQELKRKVRIGKVILIKCWSAVVITVVIALSHEKSQIPLAASAGFLGLGVATFSMLIGGKKIKETIARISKSTGTFLLSISRREAHALRFGGKASLTRMTRVQTSLIVALNSTD